MSLAGQQMFVRWAFLEKYAEVTMLGDKVAYSWTCNQEDVDHAHTIECLWVWHDCDLSVDPLPKERAHWTYLYKGWKPTGVGKHDLISIDPLHIEASVYWPGCCGMHGWIRDGVWIDA